MQEEMETTYEVNHAARRAGALDLKALDGATRDFAVGWAAAHGLTPAFVPAEVDVDELVGTVLASEVLDDGRVQITLGIAAAAPDESSDSESDDVDESAAADDSAPDASDPAKHAPAVDAHDDDYFAEVAAHNEALADESWLAQIAADQQDPVETIETDPPQTPIGNSKRPRDRRRLALGALAGATFLSLIVLLLPSGSPEQNRVSQTAAPVTAAVAVAPVVDEEPPAAAPRHRSKKTKQKPSRHRRVERHSSAASTTTPAAPRPVAPAINPPAASGSRTCGARSSEFSFEC